MRIQFFECFFFFRYLESIFFFRKYSSLKRKNAVKIPHPKSVRFCPKGQKRTLFGCNIISLKWSSKKEFEKCKRLFTLTLTFSVWIFLPIFYARLNFNHIEIICPAFVVCPVRCVWNINTVCWLKKCVDCMCMHVKNNYK